MMAYLRGDFSNRWLRRCVRNSSASVLNSKSLVVDFTSSNFYLASNPTSILSGGFIMFLFNALSWIRFYKLKQFFKTSLKMTLLKKSRTRSPIVSAMKWIIGASVRKSLKNEFIFPATISKNFSSANKESCIMLFNLVKNLFLLSGCSLFPGYRYEWYTLIESQLLQHSPRFPPIYGHKT